MVTIADIEEVFRRHHKKGYGTIQVVEANFVRAAVERHKPKRFLEIGTGSGLSTGLIARFMSEHGGEYLCSVDNSVAFWGDPSKPVGFLAKQIHTGDTPVVQLECRPASFAYLCQNEAPYDMVFIDANHDHPWPTLDTIAALPALKRGGLVFHHDLALHRVRADSWGIGPKFLYDQFPEHSRCLIDHPTKNIYALRIEDDYRAYSEPLQHALLIPWTIKQRISPELISALRDFVRSRWDATLQGALDTAVERFNDPRVPLAQKLGYVLANPGAIPGIVGRKWRSLVSPSA